MSNVKEIKEFKSDIGLADYLNKNYLNQIKNFFSDEKKALKFLSSVRADVQRNPKLLECTPESIVNSYMQMAQMGFMPSTVSGEGYVLPYNNSKKDGKGWIKVMEAQFQLGYQGLVTLFYQAGVTKIYADLVREKDQIELSNGGIKHIVDPMKSTKDRGVVVGAYVVVVFQGEPIGKYMHIDDIYAHGKKFSKSFNLTGDYSPWNPVNDPEGWMMKKTVLKQMSKLLPKNEIINKAIALDNKDSIIADRLESAIGESEGLKMKNLLPTKTNETNKTKEENNEADIQEDSQEVEDTTESIQDSSPFPG